MIAYRISIAELERLVAAEKVDWIQRAKGRTAGFRKAGKYAEASSIWGEVKAVYIRLQGEGKCIYCERKLEGEELGKAEYDVEHFRPKSSVRRWKAAQSLIDEGVKMAEPDNQATGYYLLPYHLLNYSAACKPCNSALKSDCFPIAGKYRYKGVNPKTLLAEKPLLIFPLGDFDVDPESLIRFHGVSPQPVATSGHERHRALTTIAFFELDDPIRRKNLMRERACLIAGMYPWLEILGGAPGPAAVAKTLIDGFTSQRNAHANCARSFRALYARDPAEALVLVERATAFIEASS